MIDSSTFEHNALVELAGADIRSEKRYFSIRVIWGKTQIMQIDRIGLNHAALVSAERINPIALVIRIIFYGILKPSKYDTTHFLIFQNSKYSLFLIFRQNAY